MGYFWYIVYGMIIFDDRNDRKIINKENLRTVAKYGDFIAISVELW